ncbi:MAG: SpoIIE family protein phosphatase [Bacteroidia bacterium]|nr:SpoIIE family protein phosphatase [Bacteroidia bacterium]
MASSNSNIVINKVEKDSNKRDVLMVRSLALLISIVLPILGVLHQMRGDDADPLIFRFILSGCGLTIVIGSYVSEWFRKNIIELAIGVLYLLIAWISYMVYVNNLNFQYVIGTIVVIFGSSPMLRTIKQLVPFMLYCCLCVICATFFAEEPQTDPKLLSLTIVTLIGTLYFIFSSRIKMQIKLKQNEELLRNVFNESVDSLLLVNAKDNKTLDCNNQTNKMFESKDSDEIVDHKITELIKERLSKEEIEDINEAIKKDGKWEGEMECVTKAGKVFWGNFAIKSLKLADGYEWLVRISDVTEKKLAEQEIKNQNRKITASINYAQRIQDAILPDLTQLREAFPDSFVFYKPRDVVSGDFPWFMQKGDEYYVAAVDCTGHGVPGAMMSMVGHFQLDNIVNLEVAVHPNEILRELHFGVNASLKQEDNPELSDGMDLGFCKINTKKMQVEYAGAHRPMLHLKNGELINIKGDRLPIGGIQYSSRGKEMIFTNHVIKMGAGDSIFIFTDGLPDQIGGDFGKRFMQRRVEDIILNNSDKSMLELSIEFDRAFTRWIGKKKQIDDVLLMGIRF